MLYALPYDFKLYSMIDNLLFAISGVSVRTSLSHSMFFFSILLFFSPPEPSDLESEAVSVISEAVVDFDDEVVFIESDLNRLNDELTQLLVIEQPRRPAPRIRRRARSESLVYFLDKQVLNPKKMASLGKRAARRYANSKFLNFLAKITYFERIKEILYF